jgi:hypothetical protein
VNESTKEVVVAEDGVGIGPFSRFFSFLGLSLSSLQIKKQDTRVSGLGSLYDAGKVSG